MFTFILPRLNFTLEKWKYNKELQLYVSNLGNFKNKDKQNLPIKINNSNGYAMIETATGYRLAHRIIMLTWKPIANAESLTVDHLDHNRRNNKLDNLEWVSKEENLTRAKRDLIEDTKTSTKSFCLRIAPYNGKQKKWNEKRFFSYNSLAIWLINKQGMLDTTPERITKRIKDAIAKKQPYCNYYIKVEEVK